MTGCGGLDNGGGFVSTKTGRRSTLPMPSGAFHTDCWAQLSTINGKEFDGVIDSGYDVVPEMNGIQLNIGVLMLGNYDMNESPYVVVNEDVYSTYFSDYLFVANVSIDVPTKVVMFRTMTTQKVCDSDALVVGVKF